MPDSDDFGSVFIVAEGLADLRDVRGADCVVSCVLFGGLVRWVAAAGAYASFVYELFAVVECYRFAEVRELGDEGGCVLE